MRGGELRHLITVEQPVETVGSMGGTTETWSSYFSFRAAVRYLAGSEGYQAQQVVSENKVLFKIRHSTEADGITTKMRISFDGRYFDIEFIKPVKEMNRQVHLICQEVA